MKPSLSWLSAPDGNSLNHCLDDEDMTIQVFQDVIRYQAMSTLIVFKYWKNLALAARVKAPKLGHTSHYIGCKQPGGFLLFWRESKRAQN